MGKKGSDDDSVGAMVGLGEVKRLKEERRRRRGGDNMQSADELIEHLKSQTEERRGKKRGAEQMMRRGCSTGKNNRGVDGRGEAN